MCGIAGIFSKKAPSEESEISLMCDRLTKRGPDAEGFYIDKKIALGHRRLSIIDLHTGDQPMHNADGSMVIVFNGEIYNYRELRNELKVEGFTFNTESDTEVVIQACKAWGIASALNRFEGMFAFALYDKIQRKLYIARDKFGEKPLYYSNNKNEIRFASELKAFSPSLKTHTIDKKALNYFLTLTYIPAPYTIYSEIRKLEAGCYIEVTEEGDFMIHRYFDLSKAIAGLVKFKDFEEAKARVKELITESVRQRMISDVPLGAFLSGGIDSSIIATVMSLLSDQPINTFTIGFKEKTYDESIRAQLVADKIKSNHTVYYLDYKDLVALVDDIILNYDEPFGDSSALPSYFVAKLAREKVKVVLTGDCADELFGGYEKYLAQYYIERYRKIPYLAKSILKNSINLLPHNRITNVMLRKAKKIINNEGLSDFDLHYNLMGLGFNDIERFALLNEVWYYEIKPDIMKIYDSNNGDTPLLKSQFTDIKVVLEGDMFVKTDRVCMMNSLESRAPFIDTKIVRLAFELPDHFKIKGRNKKYILKETFKDILPSKTIYFRKKGFGVPVDYWFKNELRDELEQLLNKDFVEKQGIFRYEIIKRLLDEHIAGKQNHKGKLWNLFVFQKWYLKNS